MSAETAKLEPRTPIGASTTHPGASMCIDSKGLQNTQWWVALATVGAPTLVTVFALVRLVRTGVHPAALWAFGLMYFATMLGITVGFHRYAAHRSFDCVPIARGVLIALGSMAAQGPVVHWVSNHRRHHQFSDKPGDVHSPWQPEQSMHRGFWHAHVGWMFEPEVTNPVRYSRDLLQDRALMQLNRSYLFLVVLGLVGPAVVVVSLSGSSAPAFDTLLWAGFVRVFAAHHVTWSINSITHLWGRRPFRSSDHSVNVAWLALPSAGESWHNGHHAFPGSARFGFSWYQLDLGYLLISTLERLGFASQVNRPSAAAVGRARLSDKPAQSAHSGEVYEDVR